MNALARLDPGADAWIGIAAVAAIIALIAIGAGAISRIWGRGRAAWRHDIDLVGLALIAISPAIVYGVAHTGMTLIALPDLAGHPAADEPAPIVANAMEPQTPDEPPAQPPPIAVDEVEAVAPPLPLPPMVAAEPPRAEGPTPPAKLPDSIPADVSPPPGPEAAPTPASTWRAIGGGLVAIWGIGAMALAIRLAYGLRRLSALGCRCRPANDPMIAACLPDVRAALGSEKLPPILTAGGMAGPAAIGLIRPAVVLPGELIGAIGPAELRDVLIHECAHALRRDPMIGLFQRLAALVFWPHPLIHWLNRRLTAAREDVCDDYVLRRGDACGYARTLLSLATKAGPAGRGMAAVSGFFESRSRLERRIADILSEGRRPVTRGNRWLTGMAAALLFAASFAAAGVRPASSDERADETEEPAAAPAQAPAEGPKTIIRGMAVDESGAPVPGATVNVTWLRKAPEDAVTDAEGRFSLEIGGPIRRSELVVATSADRAWTGAGKYREAILSRPSPLRIVLKPGRNHSVRVTDGAGAPVAGAAVEAQSAMHGAIARAETGADGMARFLLPADIEMDSVLALKAGAGLDYFENFRSYPIIERGPLPREIKLVLDGARSLEVKAIDPRGNPMPGVPLRPVLVQKREKLNPAMLMRSDIASVTTDSNGIARFGWLPREVHHRISVEADGRQFYHPYGTGLPETGEKTLRIVRHERVEGRVIAAGGNPAPNLLLVANGIGIGPRLLYPFARTDADGKFALLLPPGGLYTFMTVNPERAAAPLTGLTVDAGKPRTGLELRLVEPAKVRGRIAPNTPDASDEGGMVHLSFQGPEVPPAFRTSVNNPERESMHIWAAAADDGSFEIALGPGKYQISPPSSQTPEAFRVEKPETFFFDFAQQPRAKELSEQIISGTVLDATGAAYRPVTDAAILGVQSYQTIWFGKAFADGEGRFRMRRDPRGKTLYARNPEGSLAGLFDVPAEDEGLRFLIAPAAAAAGRVIDADGNPVADEGVQLRATLGSEAIPSKLISYLDFAVTDGEGHYRFAGIIPGMHCEISISRPIDPDKPGPVNTDQQSFEVRGPSAIAVGDLKVPVVPKKQAAARTPIPQEVDLSRLGPRPRNDAEAFIRIIGRGPATPELLDRIELVLRLELWWHGDVKDRAERRLGDPEFLRRADRIARDATGKPADALALIRAAGLARDDDESLRKSILPNGIDRSRSLPVRGTVVDGATGRPIAGAVVYRGSGLTRTDGSGNFRLPAAPELVVTKNPRLIQVEAEGYALGVLDGPNSEESAQKPLRAPLKREAPIVGRAVTIDGKPAEGVVIRGTTDLNPLFLTDDTHLPTSSPAHWTAARSDAQGWFAFRHLPPGTELNTYGVSHPKFFAIRNPQAAYGPLNANSLAAVTMSPGCTISGIVLDESGDPLADSAVRIMEANDRLSEEAEQVNREGRFRFENIRPGRCYAFVDSPGLAAKKVTVLADPKRPAEVQVVLEPGGEVAGKVVDAAGRPVANASILARLIFDPSGQADANFYPSPSGRTGADGTFRIGPIPPNGANIVVTDPTTNAKGEATTGPNRADVVITIRP